MSLNLSWWKNLGDPVIYDTFTSLLSKLGSESIEVAESYFLQLQKWARECGVGYQRLHQFHRRLSIGETIIDIKINDCDFEFYLFVNDMPKKFFTQGGEIQPWIISEFNIELSKARGED